MIYANKKIASSINLAQQTAQIITNVKALEQKGLIRIDDLTVYLDLSLWVDKKIATNWIDCLLIYYRVKKSFKAGTLYFKDIKTEELIGTCNNKKAKVLIFS
ncbi:hypothetical protein [Pedobacter insulae]|uniref:Uncharacterized protein n=1 Tax=Pedobacter insulae TaxID=414048 RepID=A0A1I3ADL7_9SPHI|nr:hypothetical protein [Pedobacter insulae]SFH48010.1 hypothetical protein SAMN04489864_11419 [Pedobacter insulae]